MLSFTILIALIPVVCLSQIISGTDTLQVGEGLIFGKDTVVSANLYRYEPDTTVFDFALVEEVNCCLALGCCCNGLVSSNRSMFFSKAPIDSIDFSSQLDTSASHMERFDATTEQSDPSAIPSNAAARSPDELLSQFGASSDYDEHFFVVKNAQNQFILIQPLDLWYSQPMPGDGVKMSCLIKAAFRWQLQTDGSLLFNTPSGVEQKSPQRQKRFSAMQQRESSQKDFEIYTIRGRKVGTNALISGNNRSKGVYILVNQNKRIIKKHSLILD